DTRDGLLKGGVRGAAVMPGLADRSLLLKAIHYTDNALKMPPKGKLSDALIAVLTEWVKMGAPWSKDEGARIKDKKGTISSACSPRRTTASGGAGTGWMWCIMGIHTATTKINGVTTPGPTATM